MKFGVLGAPVSVGSHHAGQEDAPAAVREAGLIGLLRAAGHEVTDHGDLTRRPHSAQPQINGVRAVDAVQASLTELAPAVTAIVTAGQIPLVLGGDCTITLGVLAGVAGLRPHLMYIDGDADLSTPNLTDSGILDSMGIAHLLGRGAPQLSPFIQAATLAPEDITLYGTHPAELADADRRLLAQHGISTLTAPEVIADPAGTARKALATVPENQPLAVHLDVDVLDSGQLPMANFPHFGGLGLTALDLSLRTFAQHRLASITLTEINPSYDPTGYAVASLVRTLSTALTP